MILSKNIEETLNNIVADLKLTDNVIAVVLGGSAEFNHMPDCKQFLRL